MSGNNARFRRSILLRAATLYQELWQDIVQRGAVAAVRRFQRYVTEWRDIGVEAKAKSPPRPISATHSFLIRYPLARRSMPAARINAIFSRTLPSFIREANLYYKVGAESCTPWRMSLSISPAPTAPQDARANWLAVLLSYQLWLGDLTSDRNSSRVSLRFRNAPSIELVTAPECCFSTPRIIMQKCRASQITATPIG